MSEVGKDWQSSVTIAELSYTTTHGGGWWSAKLDIKARPYWVHRILLLVHKVGIILRCK
jgi:hypothetical protein